jgi:EAL and modified HD-GYP domain-containing signal transduction protein
MIRQPVFDRKGRLWGYEIRSRNGGALGRADIADPDSPFFSLGADLPDRTESGEPLLLLVKPDPQLLAGDLGDLLPCERTVLLIDETLPQSPDLVHTLRGLRLEGFRLALDSYADRAGTEEFFRLADMVCCDLALPDTPALSLPPGKAAAQSKLTLVRRIERHAQFAEAKALGYHLFQGDFFKQPDLRPGEALASHAVSRLRLFRFIEAEDMEVEPLAQAISADVAISYRLLALLNSAAFGLGRTVTSVREALLLAGWKRVKNWLRVVILSDMKTPEKTTELPMLAAQRGHFLECLARDIPGSPAPDRLFLLGLFSLLDAMLDRPMTEIIGHLPLDPELRDTLCGQETAVAPWLELARSFEAGAWERLDQEVAAVGAQPFLAAKLYYEALSWASDLFQPTGQAGQVSPSPRPGQARPEHP